MKAFIHRFPRISWFLIGLAVAVPVSGISLFLSDQVIEEYKELNELVIEEYRTKVVEQESTISKLRHENSRLSSRTKTYKLIKPDGTVEERTESDMESEQELSESMKAEYQLRLYEATSKLHREYNAKIEKVTKERKKLNVEAGITTELDYYVSGSYSIYGPLTIGAGVEFKKQEYSIGLGFSF